MEGPAKAGILNNVELTRRLFESGDPPAVIGTVCGSATARDFWQQRLELARASFRAGSTVSFHEDLPTNQAFGILLLWQRLKEHIQPGRGALVAFVFGDGTRATPFTETENAQKPAIATFVSVEAPSGKRYLSMVELAVRYFAPVETYLRRSGFEGIVIKWGDEVQIPALDLSGADPKFRGADIVRFVSVRAMAEETAADKDWVGVDDEGRVTAFIPRRPLKEMETLADRGLLRRQGGVLYGGVNLGSVAISSAFLDTLLQEFRDEVNDPNADRRTRPDLDPQFFTALTIAAIDDTDERVRTWKIAMTESAAMRSLDVESPGILGRLRRVLERFRTLHGRDVKMVAMDFGDQYWGDIGQHAKMYDFYLALNDRGVEGTIARAIAGLPESRDRAGNLVAGETTVGPGVTVTDSVLIDAKLTGSGRVEKSVLIGTRAKNIDAVSAFDIFSTIVDLRLEPRSGTYRVATNDPVHAKAKERLTTLFLPDGPAVLRVLEDTDLRDKDRTYAVPILGNPLSFRAAHEIMGRVSPKEVEEWRAQRESGILRAILKPLHHEGHEEHEEKQ